MKRLDPPHRPIHIPIAPTALPTLAALGVVSLVGLLWTLWLGVILLAALICLAYFFRDPERRVELQPDALLSPADGRVMEVKEVYEDRFLGRPAWRVSIFLSLFDVHINRSPCDGRITYLHLKPGRYVPAFMPGAAKENERNDVGISSKRGDVLVVQIAGVLARRIECWVAKGDLLNAGGRIGLIRFGSRTELYLPKHLTEPCVPVGQQVKAGETVVGRWLG